jgi:hypothetical protein
VITTRAAPAQHLALLRERRIPYLVLGDRHVPLAAAFDAAPLSDDEWPTRLRLISHEALGDGSVRLRYDVVPDAAG